MAKKKSPTPQEIYLARKKREEDERDALLPPGFINHGNTCFMNSVLQGLLATTPLHQLVTAQPLDISLNTPCDPAKSPQLVNHRADDEHYLKCMPLGDIFLSVMEKAWDSQSQHRRESMSPRIVLTAIGQKYDQYLDFAQQDAHEFLRQLLDAMRMEEMDIIKKRQPQRRRKSGPPEEQSFVDMLFGGQLASILVCQKCKHVSHTYEDFNDLSLSIKPDDFVRDRKRDRLKNMAKKLVIRSNGSNGDSIQRPNSVPPPAPLAVVKEPETDAQLEDDRRKSFDVITADDSREEGWTKIGRRISLLGGSRRSRPSSPRPSGLETIPSTPPRTRSSSPLARGILRTKSPKPPKPTSAELEYLREILADIRPTSSNPFNALSEQLNGDSTNMWLKMSQLPGIEECLRLFTSVENLEGENMVGCRRCWKIKHQHHLDESSESSQDEPEPEPGSLRIQTALGHPGNIRQMSVSTPVLTNMYHHQPPLEMSDGDAASVSSLPVTAEAMSVPSISTTAPDSPADSELDTARTPVALNRNALLAPTVRYGGAESSDDESDLSSTESVRSTQPKKKEKETIRSPAYKRYLIAKPPPILVIHLKRFQQLTKMPVLSFSNGFKKMDDYVAFAEYLDLTPFLVPPKKGGKREKCMYRLYAVVVHLGHMLGGHYIAYTALPSPKKGGKTEGSTRKWAYISDTVVRLASLEEVLKSKAYLCMYERVSGL